LSLVAAGERRPEEAESLAREALSLAARFGLREMPQATWALVALGQALARVRCTLGDRAAARKLLEEVREIVEAYPDAGIFPDLIERQERELGKGSQRGPSPDGKLTDRERAVLRLFDGELSQRQIGENLFVSINTVKSHVKSIYRKLGVSPPARKP